MINLLLEETATGTTNGASKWVMTAILVVVLIGMLIMPYFSQRKKGKEYEAMLSSIRVGDLVKTAGGIIGRVKKIIDKGEIKTIILETGTQTEKSYMEFDMNMIYCVLKSTKATAEEKEDEENEDEKSDEETKEVEEKQEKIEEEPVEEKEEKKEEKTSNELKAETKTEETEEKQEPKSKTQKKAKVSVNTSSKKSSKK